MTQIKTDSDNGVICPICSCQQNLLKRHYSNSNDVLNTTDESIERFDGTNDISVPCPLVHFGCSTNVPYKDLDTHYSSVVHQDILLKAIENYVRELYSKPFNTHLSSDNREDVLIQTSESLNLLKETVSCLLDDSVEIHNNLTPLKSAVVQQQKQTEQLKMAVEENSQILSAVWTNTKVLQAEIESMKLIVHDKSGLSLCDGSYIWKITDVAEKLASAKAQRQISVYSPSFYSSPSGYKMCMRLYMNGDGQAKGTHLSLFFVLMRGEYDAVLTWPFNYKINFCLYDQTESQRHIIDSFRPDIKSNSFRRPMTDMNIASGIPKFVPISIIQSEDSPYIRDDCMFIRCLVDFESLPKIILPFAVCLNPALPLPIQRKIIQAEAEKHRSSIATEVSLVDSSTKL